MSSGTCSGREEMDNADRARQKLCFTYDREVDEETREGGPMELEVRKGGEELGPSSELNRRWPPTQSDLLPAFLLLSFLLNLLETPD